MKYTIGINIVWTSKFIVIEGEQSAAAAFALIKQTAADWIIIRRLRQYLYAFRVEEIRDRPTLRKAVEKHGNLHKVSLAKVMELRKYQKSTKTKSRESVPPIGASLSPRIDSPSMFRYVQCDAEGIPLSIGFTVDAPVGMLPNTRQRRFLKLTPGYRSYKRDTKRMFAKGILQHPPLPLACPPSESIAECDETGQYDEGMTPLRYPSIEVDVPPAPGTTLKFIVDLLFKAVPDTQGGPISVRPLRPDWQELALSVVLSCPAINFENDGLGTVTIHRNAASISAIIKGVVRQDTAVGSTLEVFAHFFDVTRFCGSAKRIFSVAAAAGSPEAMLLPSKTFGSVVVEPAAQRPDVTLYISKVGKSSSGLLKWQLVTERFDGLPPCLSDEIDLGRDTVIEAAALFKEFAHLERGKHRARIEGFGSRLWQLAPRMFHNAYWALWDRYKRPLTLQFISDEPYLPWELMRPVREDESEIHPPIALKHAVGRWIVRWDGFMPNKLRTGHIYTIAPKYKVASRNLPRAQSEAEALVNQFNAERVQGTRLAVIAFLETVPPVKPVAILHFAGHGKFSDNTSTESNIALEDGTLASSEIARPEVRLGKACRTVVFFNACEAGATGSILGTVGGWADAFLSRHFGGFIAPLWSVDDEDASIVATELIDGIINRHNPIGEILRAVREKHGDTSPTFFSYLYYGDVTACVGG